MNTPFMKSLEQNGRGSCILFKNYVLIDIIPRPSVSSLRKQWCPEIVDLIERMWAQDHQDRPTMSEVVEALEEMIANR